MSLSLTGCVSQPKISDVNNYLTIQNELSKLETYRESLQVCQGEFICAPDAYKPGLTQPPTPGFVGLKEYLSNNDCTKLTNSNQKNQCYADTRLRLIQTTESLDKAQLENFVLNRSIDRYQKSIDKIIQDFPKVSKLK